MERHPMFIDGKNIVKGATLPKVIYISLQPKSQWHPLQKWRKTTQKFIQNCKKTSSSQRNLEQEEQRRISTLSDFKIYCPSTEIIILWDWNKNRHRDNGTD